MATHVDLEGVRTWHDEHGRGEPLVALHPGLVDARALAGSVQVLAEHFRVYTPERRGTRRPRSSPPATARCHRTGSGTTPWSSRSWRPPTWRARP